MISPSKDLDRQVRDVERQFAGEVIGIRYSVGEDWSGDPAIYFRVLLKESASGQQVIGEIAHRISRVLSDIVYTASPDYIPYVNYRSEREQEELQDPQWPMLATS